MTSLSHLATLEIVAEAHAFALHDTEHAISHVLGKMRERLEASNYFAAFLIRAERPEPGDLLEGWRPYTEFAHHYRPRYSAFEKEWLERFAEPGFDPATFAHLEGIGHDRAYLFTEVSEGKTPLEVGASHLYEGLEVGDRVFCICTLTHRLEFMMSFDRLPSDPCFGAADRDFACALLSPLRPLFARSALNHGYLGASKPLTARERDTMSGLLRGLSEQEIARELSIAYSSAHHYVVSIYRKFNVSSRARLTALWLDPLSSPSSCAP